MYLNIIDAPCGYGKTSLIIQNMNNQDDRNDAPYMFVTPFLTEVERIKTDVTNREMMEPSTENHPSKLLHLKELIKDGRDIVTTHALFQSFDKEVLQLLKEKNYILVLDEVMNVMEQFPIKKDDLKLLIDAEAVYRDEVKDESGNVRTYLRWNENKIDYDTKYNNIKALAISGELLLFNENAIIWCFPVEVFKLFKHVFILTFKFNVSIQRYYYDIHGIEYAYFSVVKNNGNYELVNYAERNNDDKEQLRELIEVYDGKLNEVGKGRYALSKTWFEKPSNTAKCKALQNNARNYLMNIRKVKVKETLWTTIKGDKDKIRKKITPKGYKDGFISVTERATNEYSDRECLAYLSNRFMNPVIKKFIESNCITVNEDEWALSELIQWIWRSRIRNGHSISIYIPSERMRSLLLKYLNGDYDNNPFDNQKYQYPSDWSI